MALGDISLFNTLDKRMSYLSERQKLLAQNIANANTPNYKPREMRNPDFAKALARESRAAGGTRGGASGAVTAGRLQMTVTSANHLQPASLSHAQAFATAKDRRNYETKPDGNAVVLEEQMMKLSQNQSDYSTATAIYSKYIGMMKTALSGR